MKFLGRITDPKHVTTKEYVDNKNKELDDKKLDTSEVTEYTSDEVDSLWNSVFNKQN